MNICFIVNKHVTIHYELIARRLEQSGHTAFWLSPSRRWTEWLTDRGVSRSRILNMPDFAAEWRKRPVERATFERFEVASGLAISNVVRMCRALTRLPPDFALAYLAACARHVETFLLEHEVGVVFGEATWGFEVVIWMVCRAIGLRCVFPMTTRLPAERFAFFDSVSHKIIGFREVSDADRRWAADYAAQWLSAPRKPVFSEVLPKPFRVQKRWWTEAGVALLRPGLDRDDLTLWPLPVRFWSRVRIAFNRLLLRFGSPFDDNRRLGPYVLLCLHQQPEASIDVFGALHSDQAHEVERISRLLPSTHQLWVKEHPDAIGARSPGWLRNLARLPNVRLVHPAENTFELIREAALVVSTTGTVSLEAAVQGSPSVTLSPVFFSHALAIDSNVFKDSLDWPLREVLNDAEPREVIQARAIDFIGWAHAQSFEGFPYDPETLRNLGRNPEDVDSEVEGFAAFLSWSNLREFLPQGDDV